MTSHLHWALHDAKARFSELIELCLANGPQIVTRRGKETAVIMPVEEWRRLVESSRPTLKEALLSDKHWRGEMDIPPRGTYRWRHREIPDFSE